MIEVIGPDGRTHVFAQGTTEAQIDAAMEALYPSAPIAAAPPPIAPAPIAPVQQAPPIPPPFQQLPPPQQWAPQAEPVRPAPAPTGLSTLQIVGGAILAAVITLSVVTAFMLGRGNKPDESATKVTQANTVTTTNAVEGTIVEPASPPTVVGPAVTPEAFAGYIATQQGGNLNVRSQPVQNAPSLTKLPHGSPIQVTGSVMMADGLWRQVKVGGTTGYVRGDYISQTQPVAIAVTPPPPVRVVTDVERIGEWGTVTTVRSYTVNMRASPSLNSRVITSMPYGGEVWIIRREGNWYLVEWGGRRGWANVSYIAR